MEEAKIQDDREEPIAKALEEGNRPEGAEKEDKSAETVVQKTDSKQTDDSIVVVSDSIKQDDLTQSDLSSDREQIASNGDNHGAFVVGHQNGGSTGNAESTESFEFANGSDETSSWDSLSGYLADLKNLLAIPFLWIIEICLLFFV